MTKSQLHFFPNGHLSFADVWGLGCLFYEILTFKHAFEGTSLLNLAWKIVQDDVAPIPTSYSTLCVCVCVCVCVLFVFYFFVYLFDVGFFFSPSFVVIVVVVVMVVVCAC
jgi:hypothetical protein